MGYICYIWDIVLGIMVDMNNNIDIIIDVVE